MARMRAFLNQLLFTLEGAFIPGLAQRRNRLQVFIIKLLFTIPGIEEDFFPYSSRKSRNMTMTWKDLLRGSPERENLSNNLQRSTSYE